MTKKQNDEIDDAVAGLDDNGVPDVFSNEFATIAVAAITERSDTNTREDSKPAEDDLLLKSMAGAGILLPLLVVDNGDGTYVLHDGKGRLDRAKSLGMKVVPAMVLNPKNQDIPTASMIVNLVRSKYTPMEEAKGFKILMKKYGMTQEHIAKYVGCSQARISQKLTLLNAPKEVKEKLKKGKTTEKKARAATPVVVKGQTRIKVPADALPDNMTIIVTGEEAKLTLAYPVKSDAKLSSATHTAIRAAFDKEKFDSRRVNSAYEATKRELSK